VARPILADTLPRPPSIVMSLVSAIPIKYPTRGPCQCNFASIRMVSDRFGQISPRFFCFLPMVWHTEYGTTHLTRPEQGVKVREDEPCHASRRF
jgi:hypothetical protein